MGVIGTNLYCASELLKAYLVATGSIRSRGGYVERPDEIQSILDVLAPLSLHLRGMTHYALGVDGEEMSKFLRRRHREGWPSARDGIISVASRLEKGGSGAALSKGDLSILDGVADALDRHCASLHMEMRGSHRSAPGALCAGGPPGPRRRRARFPGRARGDAPKGPTRRPGAPSRPPLATGHPCASTARAGEAACMQAAIAIASARTPRAAALKRPTAGYEGSARRQPFNTGV